MRIGRQRAPCARVHLCYWPTAGYSTHITTIPTSALEDFFDNRDPARLRLFTVRAICDGSTLSTEIGDQDL